MPERIVSAGVFTNEIDQSLLPAAIGQIGAAIVGPTVKGPAFVPTKVSSLAEYQEIFGGYTEDSYVPFAVNEYLRNGDNLTVTRVMHESGYSMVSGALAIGTAWTSSVNKGFTDISHVLLPTQMVNYTANASVVGTSTAIGMPNGNIALTINGVYTVNTNHPDYDPTTFYVKGTQITASINPSDPNYITKIFGTSPKGTKYPVYVAYENTGLYADQVAKAIATASYAWTASLGKIQQLTYDTTYTEAYTPWITSQYINGTNKEDLFRFATLSHGSTTNHEVKVGIRDIKSSVEVSDPDGYVTFTVEVRRVNDSNVPNATYKSADTDKTPEIIESFRNVNLNPASDNYIGKKIGDRYQTVSTDGVITFNGDYANKSKYIRVDIAKTVTNKSIDKSLMPFGFRALYNPVPISFSGSAITTSSTVTDAAMFKPVSYRTSQVAVTYHKNNYLGFDYTVQNNINYLAPIPTVSASYGVVGTGSYLNTDFYLGSVQQDLAAAFPSVTSAYTGSLENALVSSSFNTNVALSTRKFMVPFQGGWDGVRPGLAKLSGENIIGTNTFGFDCSGTSTAGTVQYKKAFDLLANADYYDMNMLITPGLVDALHSPATTFARNLITDRQDAFYVMDTHTYKYNSNAVTIQDVVADTVDLDNNYVAAYWPWVRIINPVSNTPVWVPPSVVVPGALTFNDKVSAPWYAPAGLNRGGLPSVSQTYQVLSQADRNSLYEARINPIANFPADGIVVWGQKTLQARPSALDRVNVRRLLIAVKKFIASATRYLVFDPNSEITRTKFLNIVNPYLESVRAQQGLTAFRVVMDSTNNTNDLIDQNILYGQIFLQPTRTAEFIILDFNIQPTGAAFPE